MEKVLPYGNSGIYPDVPLAPPAYNAPTPIADRKRGEYLPAMKKQIAMYKERGLTPFEILKQMTIDNQYPQFAIGNPFRGGNYFNSLHRERQKVWLSYTNLADKEPNWFSRYSKAERIEIAKGAKAWKQSGSAPKDMPRYFTISDFLFTEGEQ